MSNAEPQTSAAQGAAKYKEDQGRHARMAAFWTLTLLALFGASFLFERLVRIASMRQAIGADENGQGGLIIPIVRVDVSPAFLVSAVLFLVLFFVVQRYTAKPKVADLLIDTEDELRKVTWPTLDEVINTTIVVVVFVVFLGGFLALADILLGRAVNTILFG